jgi:hypothetical protein
MLETAKINAIDTIEIIHTRNVNGVSKFILSAAVYFIFTITELIP